MDFGLKDRVALITGAARGLGRAEAEALAVEGVRLAINDIDGVSAENTAREISHAYGVEAEAFVGDVTDERGVNSMIAAVAARFDGIDILVNNAGIAGRHVNHLVEDLSVADWDVMLSTHVRSTFMCTRRVIPIMRHGGFGRIVNTSSINYTGGGRPGLSNYAAAKAGIAGFTRTLAKEIGRHGITANAIAPGFIETEMINHVSEQKLDQIREQNPLKRLGKASEVGSLVAFLCSVQSAYINGALISIDGGKQDYSFW